ncbi:hypothetical protein HK101_002007 [Irineochytrium annulatum]|nr:hypothetical protein HK101_002007 [Irineochytrium annulatum]
MHEQDIRPLFGGAIQAAIPSRFIDASNLREIPDNQEVFVDSKGTDQSLIIELLEAVEITVDDRSPAEHHFWILAEENNALEAKIASTGIVPEVLPNFTPLEAHTTSLIGTQRISKFRENTPQSANLVAVHLCVIRLPRVGTDVVITLNQPLQLGQESSSVAGLDVRDAVEESGRRAEEVFRGVVEGFAVREWGLFGN